MKNRFKIRDCKTFRMVFENNWAIEIQIEGQLEESEKYIHISNIKGAYANVCIYDNKKLIRTKEAVDSTYRMRNVDKIAIWVTPKNVAKLIMWTMTQNKVVEMKTNEVIERKYTISNKELKRLCGFEGEIITINPNRKKNFNEKLNGISSDVETWEIKTKEITK